MGAKGVDNATIADITAAAGVGLGSFYNHFTSKEHIASEIFSVSARELAEELDVVFRTVPDKALAASFVQRWFVERGRLNPVWGWFILHADAALHGVEETFRVPARKDIQRVVDSTPGSFGDVETLVTITLASIFAVMRRQLEGKAAATSSSAMVEGLLRMYGIPAAKAHRLAYTPLPAWLSEQRERSQAP